MNTNKICFNVYEYSTIYFGHFAAINRVILQEYKLNTIAQIS